MSMRIAFFGGRFGMAIWRYEQEKLTLDSSFASHPTTVHTPVVNKGLADSMLDSTSRHMWPAPDESNGVPDTLTQVEFTTSGKVHKADDRLAAPSEACISYSRS